jgi:hypothetical protein
MTVEKKLQMTDEGHKLFQAHCADLKISERDLFNEALSLMGYAIQAIKDGNYPAIVNPTEKTYAELRTPSLGNLQKRLKQNAKVGGKI